MDHKRPGAYHSGRHPVEHEFLFTLPLLALCTQLAIFLVTSSHDYMHHPEATGSTPGTEGTPPRDGNTSADWNSLAWWR